MTRTVLMPVLKRAKLYSLRGLMTRSLFMAPCHPNQIAHDKSVLKTADGNNSSSSSQRGARGLCQQESFH